VVGVGWGQASAFCHAIGGALPTEEQWEFAARGPDLRPHAWGSQTLDLARTNAFGGPSATLKPVRGSSQDRTPGEDHTIIYDMIGNAQEWTADLYREDYAGRDESWVQEAGITFRAIRGLPLDAEAPRHMPRVSAAHRDVLCATGECPPAAAVIGKQVGFRCARAARGK
jgi:formylglycine-generating enzyme required for sulfatase activity